MFAFEKSPNFAEIMQTASEPTKLSLLQSLHKIEELQCNENQFEKRIVQKLFDA